ncbi:MAG: hypothetical protein M1829_005827 [Trizodia sp. TS-e1964]|nr:MAG: hypothetical protein M1829_005827 [Trizodia sp. TS-e1964]
MRSSRKVFILLAGLLAFPPCSVALPAVNLEDQWLSSGSLESEPSAKTFRSASISRRNENSLPIGAEPLFQMVKWATEQSRKYGIPRLLEGTYENRGYTLNLEDIDAYNYWTLERGDQENKLQEKGFLLTEVPKKALGKELSEDDILGLRVKVLRPSENNDYRRQGFGWFINTWTETTLSDFVGQEAWNAKMMGMVSQAKNFENMAKIANMSPYINAREPRDEQQWFLEMLRVLKDAEM